MTSSATYPPFGSTTPYAEPLWYSRNQSPHYTDSHRKLRAAVRKYVDDEILPFAFDWETDGQVPDKARDNTVLENFMLSVSDADSDTRMNQWISVFNFERI